MATEGTTQNLAWNSRTSIKKIRMCDVKDGLPCSLRCYSIIFWGLESSGRFEINNKMHGNYKEKTFERYLIKQTSNHMSFQFRAGRSVWTNRSREILSEKKISTRHTKQNACFEGCFIIKDTNDKFPKTSCTSSCKVAWKTNTFWSVCWEVLK